MKIPEFPKNEQARLSTLRSLQILDSDPEERFDCITRVSQKAFDVPIALVSLVDANRQWFKSKQGLDADETPRDISFCGHAILGDEVFVVEDASKDERFADNPLVTGEPNIRFYAGCPLKYLDGNSLGTLCIIDRKPHSPSPEELATLKDLAYMVEREIAGVQMATRDELTDVYNRRGFQMLAEHCMNVAERTHSPLSLLFFDLDKFKQVNDTYGHAEGDRILVDFATQAQSAFRDSDVFGRLGGDEFVAVLNGTSKAQAERIVERIRATINQFNQNYDHDRAIAFSCGVVQYDEAQHKSIDDLLADGDSAMYADKHARKASMRSTG